MRYIKNCIFLSLLLLYSCSFQHQQIPDNQLIPLTILKVSDPKYLEYVVAENVNVKFDSVDASGLVQGVERAYKIRGEGAVYQELYIGRSPYIPLEDNFYLVDWKWGSFIYEPSNVLLNVKWNAVNNRREEWNLNTEIISSDFLVTWGWTDRGKIDDELGIKDTSPLDYMRPNFYGLYNTIDEIPDTIVLKDNFCYTMKNYQDEVLRQDSLQRVYVERLSKIILNNSLNKIAHLFD